MSGGYSAFAGGIDVSGESFPAVTQEASDRHIHLIIYQLASFMYNQDYSAKILDAARQALGGEPQSGEIQVQTGVEGDRLGSDLTAISVNNGNDRAYAMNINFNITRPPRDPNEYYTSDLQDLSIVVTVLQLATEASNRAANQPILNVALAALKAFSKELDHRAQHQGWKLS